MNGIEIINSVEELIWSQNWKAIYSVKFKTFKENFITLAHLEVSKKYDLNFLAEEMGKVVIFDI